MIEVVVCEALETFIIQGGTFLEGEKYFVRQSKHEDYIVARCEEGHWVITKSFKEANYSLHRLGSKFKVHSTIYMLNRKRLNQFLNVDDYMNGNNATKWWYANVFRDNDLNRKRIKSLSFENFVKTYYGGDLSKDFIARAYEFLEIKKSFPVDAVFKFHDKSLERRFKDKKNDVIRKLLLKDNVYQYRDDSSRLYLGYLID